MGEDRILDYQLFKKFYPIRFVTVDVQETVRIKIESFVEKTHV
jgi:hypothetical protein